MNGSDYSTKAMLAQHIVCVGPPFEQQTFYGPFEDYAMDLLADIGDLPGDMPWYIVIDQDATANNLLVDYSSISIDDTTYYYR